MEAAGTLTGAQPTHAVTPRVARAPAAFWPSALVLGNTRLPHGPATRGFVEGIGWLAQIGLFVMLGLLASPARLPGQVLQALAIAALLMLIARRAAVLAATLPLGSRGGSRHSCPGQGCAAPCRSSSPPSP